MMVSKGDSESFLDDSEEIEKANKEETVEFSSSFSMRVSLLGYTLGNADVWKFPFLVYRNGGGAFLLPFLFTVVICGVPMYFLEYSVANFSGKGPYGIWDLCPLFRGVGVSIAVGYFVYMIGASIFRSWLAMFLLDSVRSPLPWTHCNNTWNTPMCKPNFFMTTVTESNTTSSGFNNSTAVITNSKTIMTAAEEYWQYEALQLSTGLTDLSPFLLKHMIPLGILRIVVFLSCIKSIKSIEKIMYVLTFVPILFTVVVMFQSLTLPGSLGGLYEFFYPNFSNLNNVKIWIEAFLMAFYTLNFGWGGIITLGSHAKFKDNCVRSSILLPIADTTVAIMSGAVSFMILGNMAHSFGVSVFDVINAGFSAGLVSYVSALSILPFPQFWTFTFIVSAIFTGLDSQIIPMEIITQVIEEMLPSLFPKYRIHTLAVISTLMFLLSLPTCTGGGAYIFLLVDWYVGTWVGPLCAFMEIIAVGWCYGIDRFSLDVALMTGKPPPWFFRFFVAFVAPVVVFVIFLTACVEYVPPRYGSYIYPGWARGVGWMIVFCIMSPVLIMAVLLIRQQRGSSWMKLKRSLRSIPSWRPKDLHARKDYKPRILSDDTSFKDMLYFTMFGSYRRKKQSQQHEMSSPEN